MKFYYYSDHLMNLEEMDVLPTGSILYTNPYDAISIQEGNPWPLEDIAVMQMELDEEFASEDESRVNETNGKKYKEYFLKKDIEVRKDVYICAFEIKRRCEL